MTKYLVSIILVLASSIASAAGTDAKTAPVPMSCEKKLEQLTAILQVPASSCETTKKVPAKKAKKPVAKKTAPVQAPVIKELVPACSEDGCGNTTKTVVEKTVVERVVEVRDTCIHNDTKYLVVDGKCQVPAVTVPLSTKVEPSVTATCPSCNTRPSAAVQSQPAAMVVGERQAKVCGIEILESLASKKVVGNLQLDEDPAYLGKLRISKVESFEGKSIQVSVSSLPYSGVQGCNIDQATIYQNWPQIIKKFNLPNDCIPRSVKKST